MSARCDQGHPMRCARVELDRLGRTVAVTWRCLRCGVDARVTAHGVTTAPAPSWAGGPRPCVRPPAGPQRATALRAPAVPGGEHLERERFPAPTVRPAVRRG